VEFNSACFYRYANVDLGQLVGNLQDDVDLARSTLTAFLRASVAAVPTGKQNSTAAQNPPSFVFAVVRERQLWSLANAFLRPVRATEDEDLVALSTRALDAYWGQLARMYGEAGIAGKWYSALDAGELRNLRGAEVPDVETLIEKVLHAATFVPAGSQ
jgi:CRISPR system Cascade subunit CasC